jgi:hypothetical protein
VGSTDISKQDASQLVIGIKDSMEDASAVQATSKTGRTNLHIRITGEGTAISAPPGLGPPGIWIWPHSPKKESPPKSEDDALEPNDDDSVVSWPRNYVDSPEVEFVGRVAQLCFGGEFIKLTVSWAEPWVTGDRSVSSAIMGLHLKPTATAKFTAPLALLQAMLARDQGIHRCQIFRMERSKDDVSLHISCSNISASTCWDVLKKGFCPRPNCTWEHPVPVLMNVTCVGLSAENEKGPPTAMSKMTPDVASAQNRSEDEASSHPTLLTSSGTTAHMHVQLNMGAYDELDDSDDDM